MPGVKVRRIPPAALVTMRVSTPSAAKTRTGSTDVDDHAWPDEPLERQLIDAGGVVVEVVRRVDMGSRLGPHVHGQEVKAVALYCAVHRELHGGIAGVHLGLLVE